jgi:hypothetical protein
MNNSKSFLTAGLVVILMLMSSVGFYYIGANYNSQDNSENEVAKNTSNDKNDSSDENSKESAVSEEIKYDTSSWNRYESDEFELAFYYPDNYEIDETELSSDNRKLVLRNKDLLRNEEAYGIITISPSVELADNYRISFTDPLRPLVVNNKTYQFLTYVSAEAAATYYNASIVYYTEITPEKALSINSYKSNKTEYPEGCNVYSGIDGETGEQCEGETTETFSVSEEQIETAHQVLNTIELL